MALCKKQVVFPKIESGTSLSRGTELFSSAGKL